MSADSGDDGEQRRVIDVDAVSAYLCAAHLKYIGKWYGDLRSIMTGVGHGSLAGNSVGAVPRQQKLVMTGGYRRKKCADRRADLFRAGDHRGIPEAKLRVRREQTQETRRVASVDDCEQTPPPCAIRLKYIVWHDFHAPSILEATHKRLITNG